jgi:L-threonylcarbamoyladenylate synthase
LAVTRVIPIDANAPDRASIREAAGVLRSGGLVAFPTETVYGLGAHALDEKAVARIFEAKGRPPTDPLIVHIAEVDQLDVLATHTPDAARQVAKAFWPGPLTIILEKTTAVPDIVTAGLASVAIRMPSHPIARALIEEAGIPVAAPSANRFSRPSPTRAEHVLADLDGLIDVLIDGGPTPIGVESTIVDFTISPPVIRRPGGVSQEALRRVLPEVTTLSRALTSEVAQPAPGQLLRHYAPRATLTLYVGDIEATTERVSSEIRTAVAAGLCVGVLAPEEDLLALAPRVAAVAASGRVVTSRCGSRADRDETARDLFRALRALDDEGVDVIFATSPPGGGINAAIVDRLTRAAEGRVVRVR